MADIGPGGVLIEHLIEVPLRDVWADEASIFTPWLASHPEYLSEALGMNLELVGTELAVGPFSADIVLVDTGSGGRVIVENYLEATDHDHVGKLITYASGLEGSYAVLIAKMLRPEHRTALKWLNDISMSGTGFFGLEVHAVRIGNSLPAVRLEVVVEPDDWQRQAREIATGQLSESQARYVDWWSQFLPALQSAYPGWTSASKPPPVNWINLPTGRSGVRYGVSFSWPTGATGYRLRVELYMDDGTTWWPILEAHKATIEDALGADLVWEPLEESKASRVAMYFDGVDPDDRAAWPTYRNWAIDKLGDFRAALQPIVASGVASSQSTPVVPAPQPPVSLS